MHNSQHEVVWCEQRKRFQGKKTHVTMTTETPFGRFAIMTFPKPTHGMRGGSSFLAADGRCFLKVKSLHENDDLSSCQLATATICGYNVQINHDFERDGHICCIPGSWPLGGEVREITEMRFVFESRRADPKLCFAVRQQVVRGACVLLWRTFV